MSPTVRMNALYDHRIVRASPYTACMLDVIGFDAHERGVESARALLDRLRGAGVTQEQIAKVLGISQPNAATFYNPGKNGKFRQLKWDEGAKLLAEFGMEIEEAERAELSSELLMPIVAEMVRHAQRRQAGSIVRPLAVALARYLRQIAASPTIHANQDALEAVAQAVVPAPLEATQ